MDILMYEIVTACTFIVTLNLQSYVYIREMNTLLP